MYARIAILLVFFLAPHLHAEDQSATGKIDLPEIVIESSWFPDEKPDEFTPQTI